MQVALKKRETFHTKGLCTSTVQCNLICDTFGPPYDNMFILLQNTHWIPSVAGLLGWSMEYPLWIHSLVYTLSSQVYIQITKELKMHIAYWICHLSDNIICYGAHHWT